MRDTKNGSEPGEKGYTMFWEKSLRKCANRRGAINRLIAILLSLTAVLLLAIAIPIYLRYKRDAEAFACMMAQNKAQSMVAIESMFNDWDISAEEAAAVADRTRYQRDSLCPAGGDYFIVWEEQPDSRYADTHYKVVCGLHDEDAARRTRLCSGAALSRLVKALDAARKNGNPSPKKLKITLNGKDLTCRRVEKNPGLRFGTKNDIDRKGTVCYYAVVGDDNARKETEKSEGLNLSGLKAGEVWYFGYANEDCASVWVYGKGWSGDAWRDG